MGNSQSGELIDYNPQDYKDVPKDELELYPFMYPNMGVYHMEVPVEMIAKLPLEEQMKYSDAICRRYALNPHFLKTQDKGIDDLLSKSDEEFLVYKQQFNDCGIGDMAYMAHYHRYDENGKDSKYYTLWKRMVDLYL